MNTSTFGVCYNTHKELVFWKSRPLFKDKCQLRLYLKSRDKLGVVLKKRSVSSFSRRLCPNARQLIQLLRQGSMVIINLQLLSENHPNHPRDPYTSFS